MEMVSRAVRACSFHLHSRRAQRGVTSIEYALLGALIAMSIVAVVTTLGLTLSDFYDYVAEEVANAASIARD